MVVRAAAELRAAVLKRVVEEVVKEATRAVKVVMVMEGWRLTRRE